MSTSPQPTGTPTPVPGHAPLRRYYGADSERKQYVSDIFNRTAHHYNTIEMLLLNGGLWYRRFCLKRAGLRRGMKVLDVAIGTAAVARGAVQLVGSEGKVYGVDPSPGMLAQAQQNFDGPLTRGVAEGLPFADDTFDFVTMGIALRHVSDLIETFREYQRVLKPGGTMWILEGHSPASPVGRKLMRLMMGHLIPGMTLMVTRSREAKELMDFYWDTVEQSASPDQILRAMRDVGFEQVEHRVVSPVCEYIGRKPGPGPRDGESPAD